MDRDHSPDPGQPPMNASIVQKMISWRSLMKAVHIHHLSRKQLQLRVHSIMEAGL